MNRLDNATQTRIDLTTLLTLADIEQAAISTMDKSVCAYVAGGAGAEKTIEANIAAFESIWLRPRVFRSTCEKPGLEVKLFDQTLSMPVLLAPTSPQRLLHEGAELATARAALAAGTIPIVSTDSHYPFTSVSEASNRTSWFQLYPYRSRADVIATIDMAIEAGATVIVLTVDASYPARRISAKRSGFRTPDYVDFGILRSLGILEGNIPADGRMERMPLTWDDMKWIRSRTPVPLVIKGILHREDARRCVTLGADGVIVSNHGGRQLDSVLPSIVALEEIVDEVGNDCVVLVDGGIRSGLDVIKALALGAKAVCIGRPYLWGLSLDGEEGIRAVLQILRSEIEDTLCQLGLESISQVGSDCLSGIRWRSRKYQTKGETRYAHGQ